jgi:hypothetical protein
MPGTCPAEGFQAEQREPPRLGVVERLASLQARWPARADSVPAMHLRPWSRVSWPREFPRRHDRQATHAILLGLLVAAIALGGMLTVAHSALDWCAQQPCAGVTGTLTAGGTEPRQHPTEEPCGQTPVCGGGAAHTLGTTLAIGVVALTGAVLLQPGLPGRTLGLVTGWLHSLLLPSGLDRPPRLAS